MENKQTMQEIYEQLIEKIGEDPKRDGLRDTPRRAAKAMEYLTQGYRQNLDEIVNNALFNSDCDELVVVRDIELFSLCEHHMLPFIGSCHIGYIPNGQVLGLSKFARIVDHFSQRLQIQENLTKQIADAVAKITGSSDVGVVIEAKHLCMMMRGVEKQNSSMTSSVMLGCFRHEAESRAELLKLVCR
jgi:GTP cyclohydrolase I